MRGGSFLKGMRRGRASWAVATLYVLMLPIMLGLLPKPAPTAEFLLLRDIAAGICTLPGGSQAPGQPMQHQPDCILCAPGCPLMGSSPVSPPTEAAAEPFFVQLALAVPPPKDFVLPASRRFSSDIQSRGPPHGA